jgi:hypothetical protein
MTRKLSDKIQELLEVQGQPGNWNYDPYMLGLYNGLELARAAVDNDNPPPKFRSKPETGWLRDHAVEGYVGAPVQAETLAEAQDII